VLLERRADARLVRVKHAVAARAYIVGSLLRPQELLEARERYAAGELSAAEFKRIEDRAVEGLSICRNGRVSPLLLTVRCVGSRSRASW
jgi:hypothetical protein